MKNNYTIKFIPQALILFVLIMLPNFIWFAIPAPNDILRQASATPMIDGIASVVQVVMVALLCMISNKAADKFTLKSKWILSAATCCLVYYVGWALYYFGLTDAIIMLILSVVPCLAFILFSIDRRNYPALIMACVFAALHILFAVVNFIL